MIHDSSKRSEALNQIVALATQHGLSIDDIGGALTQGHVKDKSSKVLIRVLGYLGASLIFGGLCLYIGMQWPVLPPASRVIVTYGSGFAAFVLALFSLHDPRYQKASSPLFLVSAFLLPTGMFVFLKEYGSGGDKELASIIVFSLCSLQFFSVFSKFRTTAILFFGYLFYMMAVFMWMNRIDIPNDVINLTLSVSALCFAWGLDRTAHRSISPLWYFLGGGGLIFTVFDIFHDGPLDFVMIGVSAFMMLVSIRVQSRTLLRVNTIGLLGFLCYYTERYFKDVVGWPIALIIMGFLLVGVSAWAVKMGQKIKETKSVDL